MNWRKLKGERLATSLALRAATYEVDAIWAGLREYLALVRGPLTPAEQQEVRRYQRKMDDAWKQYLKFKTEKLALAQKISMTQARVNALNVSWNLSGCLRLTGRP